MKVTEHVRYLLRQGRKPKELVQLGFPKSVVTRIRKQLREEKTTSQSRTAKGKAEVESCSPSKVTAPAKTAPVPPKPEALRNKVRQLESRVKVLEALSAKLEDIETRLDGTPALGLRHRFKCDCGTPGFVALHIKCTKCRRETYWGWCQRKSDLFA